MGVGGVLGRKGKEAPRREGWEEGKMEKGGIEEHVHRRRRGEGRLRCPS